MPHHLNPREVLSYLNVLGYTNINAQQLKEFMIDLKKLMKYDERYYDEESEPTQSTSYIPDSLPRRDVFEALYNTNTIASRAKLNGPKKESIITVQVNGPRSTTSKPIAVQTTPSVLIESTSREASSTHRSSVQEPLQTHDKQFLSARSSVQEPLQTHDKQSLSARSSSQHVQPCCSCSVASNQQTSSSSQRDRILYKKEKKGCKVERNKSSFIRPRLNTKPPKSDPVALYHQYREEWKKYKIPGKDDHAKLRWDIRGRMLGDKYDYCY